MGGILLNTHISEYKELITSFFWLDNKTLENQSVSLFSPFHIGYEKKETLIMIYDVITGKLQRICALKKYTGLLGNGIRVGMPILEAKLMEPNLYYNEQEELYFIRGIEGVSLETDVYNKIIEIITVYI